MANQVFGPPKNPHEYARQRELDQAFRDYSAAVSTSESRRVNLAQEERISSRRVEAAIGDTVRAQLLAQGNPNPPGRPAGPGQQMPVYQGVPGAPWDGAARGVANAPDIPGITAHINMPSNGTIHSAAIAKPWKKDIQLLMREGQFAFTARQAPGERGKENFDGVETLATLGQLNILMAEAHAVARQRLKTGNLPDGIRLTPEEFDAVGEENIYDYLGRREKDIDGEQDPNLQAACTLLKIGVFKYLLPIGAAMYWNPRGGISNTTMATSPLAKSGPAIPLLVANMFMAKDGFLSNVWGGADKVAEQGKFGLILRRAGGEHPEHASAPAFYPWADKDAEIPALMDQCYYNEDGRLQPGYYIPLGTVRELTSEEPIESKRRDAVAAGGGLPIVSHEGMGSMPRIRVSLNA